MLASVMFTGAVYTGLNASTVALPPPPAEVEALNQPPPPPQEEQVRKTSNEKSYSTETIIHTLQEAKWRYKKTSF